MLQRIDVRLEATTNAGIDVEQNHPLARRENENVCQEKKSCNGYYGRYAVGSITAAGFLP
jgi:hypothetical protein